MLNRGEITAVVLGVALLLPAVGQAQTVRVQTDTQARMTQMRRIDGTVDAGRVFSQSARVSGFDLLGTQTNSLSAHVGFRFWNDFGLVNRLKDDAVTDMYWNQTLLEEAYVRWQPLPTLMLRAGRHMRLDALGAKDVDGLSVMAQPKLGRGVRGVLEVWAGQDVMYESSPLAPDLWDIQGVPEGSQAADADWSISGGARAGLNWSKAGIELAWNRREYTDAQDTYLAEERVGTAVHGQVTDALNVSAKASFHTILNDVDRAAFLAAYTFGPAAPTLSTGVERVVPWFDSGSIFNVFGAQPYEGAWIKGQQRVEALNTEFDVRLFGRIYEGDQDLVDLGAGTADATTYGVGTGHETSTHIFGRTATWNSVVTYSDSIDDAYGGSRALAQTRLRVQALNTIGVESRLVWLWSQPANARYREGQGVTGTLGMDWRTDFGAFVALVESSRTTFQGGNLQAYVSYRAEVWP